jgi:hypothetical protein
MSEMPGDDLQGQLLEWVRNRYFGKYRGVIADNDDLTRRGRVKVRVPAVIGDLEVWAMPCVPYAGDGVGSYLVPPIGAGVWVEFEGGDPSFAIWTGCFWADDQPPENVQGTSATPDLKIIRTATGLMITLDDANQVLTLSDQDGRNYLTLDIRAGLVTIEAALKVVVEAPQIELVRNATHPIVFGDNLLRYLNQLVQIYQTHLHPGQLALGTFAVTPAPPVPPFPPATPELLSTKVKAG